MLSDEYLIAGLDAMVRTFSSAVQARDGFVDGHRAAGMLSAWFLAHDRLVEDRALPAIARALDSEWMNTPLFAPGPADDAVAPTPVPPELGRLADAISGCVGTPSGDPHSVIFPALALKALHRFPAAITRARIDGLCHMARIYSEQLQEEAAQRQGPLAGAQVAVAGAVPSAGRFDPDTFSTWALEAFADGISGYVGNWPHLAGHILTYSAAVVDLYELGYDALARKAQVGLEVYVAHARQTKPWPETVPADLRRPLPRDSRPELAAFWEEHPAGSFDRSLAHALKYPYGYLQLMRRSTHRELKQRLRSCAYVLLDWYLPLKAG